MVLNGVDEYAQEGFAKYEPGVRTPQSYLHVVGHAVSNNTVSTCNAIYVRNCNHLVHEAACDRNNNMVLNGVTNITPRKGLPEYEPGVRTPQFYPSRSWACHFEQY